MNRNSVSSASFCMSLRILTDVYELEVERVLIKHVLVSHARAMKICCAIMSCR